MTDTPTAPGPRYSSWLIRNVVKAYGILALGVILSFAVTGYTTARTTAQIERDTRASCEAGNQRSRLQLEDYVESAAQLQRADLEELFGVGPEQAAEFRRLGAESTARRIAAVPFIDCKTGERVPPPAVP